MFFQRYHPLRLCKIGWRYLCLQKFLCKEITNAYQSYDTVFILSCQHKVAKSINKAIICCQYELFVYLVAIINH